jgi:hypothetical protein
MVEKALLDDEPQLEWVETVRNMQRSIPQGPKATYIVHVHVYKYAGNP